MLCFDLFLKQHLLDGVDAATPPSPPHRGTWLRLLRLRRRVSFARAQRETFPHERVHTPVLL